MTTPYATYSSVASIDAVLGYIASFIGGLPNWTIVQNMVTPNTAPSAGGHEFVAYNGPCLVGMRSITTGNLANRLFLLDGTGPYTSGNVGTLNGDSGLGASYTVSSLMSGVGSPGSNSNYYSTPFNMRGIFPASTQSSGVDVVLPGPYNNLWLFSNDAGAYVHVVLQIDGSNYRHMLFGRLTQYGTWSNTALGAYYAGTYWSLGGYESLEQPYPISAATGQNHAAPFQ